MQTSKRKQSFKKNQAKTSNADYHLHQNIELEPKNKARKEAGAETLKKKKEEIQNKFSEKHHYDFNENLCSCHIHNNNTVSECKSNHLTKNNKSFY